VNQPAEPGQPLVPLFRDLPTLPETPERHAWQVWGPDDQLGTVNFIGPAQVTAATATVTHGTVVCLSAPLNEPGPGLSTRRTAYQHTIVPGSHGRDDRLDGFWLQFSSQWDGLRHVRYRHFGFYGGRQDTDVDEGGALGIERWARHGIIGRGVLLDAARYFEHRGTPLPPDARRPITPDDLDAIAAAQGVTVRPGDIVMVRTGWLGWYLELPADRRRQLHGTVATPPNPFSCPGLDPGQGTAQWLWDHRVAAVAADNMALETLPVDREAGFLHYRLIPMLGMAIGEYWALDDLARQCAAIGRWEFLFTSGILNLPGGVGSPTSAYAVL
jgi:kynurenine formamidase